jgi:ornithine decarboxylase
MHSSIKVLTNSKHKTLYQAIEQLSPVKETPVLIMDTNLIKENYEHFRRELEELSDAKVFYAVKANSHPGIVKFLHELGAGFEIASEEELDLVLSLNVPPSKIVSSNPVKTPSFIKSAYAKNVVYFAFDSYAEIEKLSQLAPESNVYVRLSVSNQCNNPATWVKAIEKSKIVWELTKSKGMELQLLNIGGGFPCEYAKHVPSITEIIRTIKNSLKLHFPQDVKILVEPGRALVGEAGILATTVIGKAARAGREWLYLDAGVFNGLMEATGGIKYRFVALRNGVAKKWVLAGPSCDTMDIISKSVDLPEPAIGDKVYVMSAGAYTTAYASRFDGFRVPRTYLI